jgi:hypothetical protein
LIARGYREATIRSTALASSAVVSAAGQRLDGRGKRVTSTATVTGLLWTWTGVRAAADISPS